MRLILISDTHGRYPRVVPEGDVLIHSGDICMQGDLKELQEFSAWFSSMPHPQKVVIAGNHDFCLEKEESKALSLLKKFIYLNEKSVVVNGLKIFGSPWSPTPPGQKWAFNEKHGPNLNEKWKKIPTDLDILITHGPPFTILDQGGTYMQNLGCKGLLNRVFEIKPKLHIFGHIHEYYGRIERDGMSFVNASLCNVHFQDNNQPIVIDA